MKYIYSESETRNVPATPPPGEGDDVPAIPLPPVVGNPEPNPDSIPEIPLPPIVGNPESNPDNIPVIPLPPIVGTPDSGVQQPAAPGPGGYATIRFLHAADGYGPLNVQISNRTITSRLSYTRMTGYGRIADGFYTVTISSSRNTGNVYFRKRVPFNTGEKVTFAIVRARRGLDLIRISDQSCVNRPRNRGCVRAVNLIYNSPALDVILNDGRVLFSDVRYKEVTAYKQARPGEYDYYVAETPYSYSPTQAAADNLDDLPVIMNNFYLFGYGDVMPLVSSYITVEAGGTYSIYMFGNWDNSSDITVKTVE
ncbi:DUF4397 domain-containing protein [Anaerolentibacter hominis]|uniref:DUF4397 domain-containing protein n=1 Tax=Anaerolentibacter hominis TaxID=3079009 RepID=UPI0031B81130